MYGQVLSWTIAAVVVCALSIGCGKPEPPQDTPEPEPKRTMEVKAAEVEPFVQDARARVKRMKTALGAALLAAMKRGGPGAAIHACAEQAPVIANTVSDGSMKIRRVGTRVRNKETNAPSAELRGVLETLTREKPAREVHLNGRRAWIQGIFIERPVCLSCHGPPGSLDPEVSTALKNLYPQDEATGYRMGDLRGAFVVEDLN